MDPEPTDADLLLLSLSLHLSDSEPEEEAAAPTTTTTTTSSSSTSTSTSTSAPTTKHQPTRAERTALSSEEAFQSLKQSYRPKMENGNHSKVLITNLGQQIYQTLPTGPHPYPTTAPLPKPEAQALLHAAEELYFFRRYDRAVTFLRQILDDDSDDDGGGGGGGGSGRIDGETKKLLGYYLSRCEARLRQGGGGSMDSTGVAM